MAERAKTARKAPRSRPAPPKAPAPPPAAPTAPPGPTVAALRAQSAPYNPRRITDAQLKMLGAAMAEYGDLGGIVVNRRTSQVVGGHQRLKQLDPAWPVVVTQSAAPGQALDATGTVAVGHVETPRGRWAYREVDWPEAREKAANVSANKNGGEFDFPKLKDLLVELDDGTFDLRLTGFDDAELKELIDWQGQNGTTVEDEAPPPPQEAKTQPGDLYLLGEHRLLCGDSAQADIVQRVMDGRQADMLFADPPYGVDYGAKNRFLNSFQPSGRNLRDIDGDTAKKDDLYKILVAAFSNARDAMKDTASFYVTSPQGGELGMMMMMIDAGLPARHVLVWLKNCPTFSMGRLDYDYQHEPILYGWKKTHIFQGKGEHTKSVWAVDKPRENKEHPTMKPVALMANALKNSTEPGETVLDHFGGSGSTLIAAEQTGRKACLVEIAPVYCDVIVARWEKLTGKTAVLHRDGKVAA